MKKFNIFEVYGNVHGEVVETPKVEVQSYSPISVGRKVPMIVDGKFSLTESLKPKSEIISEVKKLKPNTSSKAAQRVIAKIKKDWGASSDVYEELSDWMVAWYKSKDPDAPLAKPAIDAFNHIIDNYDLIEGVNENLLGMKKEPIDNYGSVERYEYVIKGKKAKVTIDVMKHKEQGMPGSNFVSIRSSMGEWLADTPKNFKKISELEAFVKKVHPNLVKIANGETKSGGVAFPD
jgi:hypothetical protein